MSIDSQIEEDAYKAIESVIKMMWPKQRERILKNIMSQIMVSMKWPTVTIEDGRNAKQPQG